MTTAITMKVTLGALAGLLSYCESKKMKMAKIQAHVSNIAFIELNHASFAYAKDLLNEAADKRRTYAGVANCIQAAITEINRVIDAAHAEALEMDAVVNDCVNRFKYCIDHFQAECNVKNEIHGLVIEKGYALGWTARMMVNMVANVWRLGEAAAKAHRAHTAAMLAAAPANGSTPDYDIPF